VRAFLKALACISVYLSVVVSANAQGEPLGGQPEHGAKQSVEDLDVQVAYHRAFDAVLWAMPASAVYRFRVGLLEIPGMDDNVIGATSRPLTPIDEGITTVRDQHL
jgi:hypothetical protein